MSNDGRRSEELHPAIRRNNAAMAACTGIPTKALEAGVVGKMAEALEATVAEIVSLHTAIARGDDEAGENFAAQSRAVNRARALLSQIKGGGDA